MLILVVSLVGSIPWLLTFASQKLIGHIEYFYYLWGVYVILELFVFFFWRRKTITFNSWTTQNMVWAIFTLGFYMVVDLPKYLPPHLRQIALWLWCSFAMIFNFIWFFIDDNDYVEDEKKEARKEEKRMKREEVKKQKEAEENKDKGFGKNSALIINVLLYSVILIGGSYYGYYWYHDFQSRVNKGVYQEPVYNDEDI